MKKVDARIIKKNKIFCNTLVLVVIKPLLQKKYVLYPFHDTFMRRLNLFNLSIQATKLKTDIVFYLYSLDSNFGILVYKPQNKNCWMRTAHKYYTVENG